MFSSVLANASSQITHCGPIMLHIEQAYLPQKQYKKYGLCCLQQLLNIVFSREPERVKVTIRSTLFKGAEFANRHQESLIKLTMKGVPSKSQKHEISCDALCTKYATLQTRLKCAKYPTETESIIKPMACNKIKPMAKVSTTFKESTFLINHNVEICRPFAQTSKVQNISQTRKVL